MQPTNKNKNLSQATTQKKKEELKSKETMAEIELWHLRNQNQIRNNTIEEKS